MTWTTLPLERGMDGWMDGWKRRKKVGVRRGWREKERRGEKHQWLIKRLTSEESEGGWWRMWATKDRRENIQKLANHYFCVRTTNKSGVEVGKLWNIHYILNWIQIGLCANPIQAIINCVFVRVWWCEDWVSLSLLKLFPSYTHTTSSIQSLFRSAQTIM